MKIHEEGDLLTSTKTFPLKEKKHWEWSCTYISLYERKWRLGMDTPAFEVMQLCNLTKDKEMNMASLLLKLLELSITIYTANQRIQRHQWLQTLIKAFKMFLPLFFHLYCASHPILASDKVEINQNRINEQWSRTQNFADNELDFKTTPVMLLYWTRALTGICPLDPYFSFGHWQIAKCKRKHTHTYAHTWPKIIAKLIRRCWTWDKRE